MGKLFDILTYIITLPLTVAVAIFKTAEKERNVSFNSDQGVKDGIGFVKGTKSIFDTIDRETDTVIKA